MSIQSITPNFTGNAVYRISKSTFENSKLPYFYNYILKTVREQKLPANFANNHVDITFDAKYQQNAIETFKNTMKDAGIKLQLII